MQDQGLESPKICPISHYSGLTAFIWSPQGRELIDSVAVLHKDHIGGDLASTPVMTPKVHAERVVTLVKKSL